MTGVQTCALPICKAAVDLPDIETFDNDAFAETSETASLYAARPFLEGDVLITYGDILFDEFILRNLISQTQGVTIAVDGGWKMRYRSGAVRDLVVTSDTSDTFGEQQCRLQAIGADLRSLRPASGSACCTCSPR